jgi:hypothetical protein
MGEKVRVSSSSREDEAGKVVLAQMCISATPPLAQKHARYLVKRLTDVPIVAGIWGATEDRVKRL